MKYKKVISAAILSVFAAAAYAETVGYSSNTANVVVKAAEAAYHGGTVGSPALSVEAAPFPYNMAMSFSAYQKMGTTDANGVHIFNGSSVPGHSVLGNTRFDQVDTAAANVYFGEWSNAASDTASHTVYYAGDNKTADMPTTGTATYSLKGMNNYDGNNQMRGKFVANFGTQTYAGNVRNSDYKVTMNGAIDTANAAFSGTAKAGSVVGVSQGNFFGANAAAVAGVATFAGRPDLDTAFGGAKQ